ncbi:MAG: toxin-antitoxin system YwqK family antitoxin [Bacteroidetes bacterium]|nr:toxin-antitoxin system YwqK family antitoxin [Bacteroidota bacterium]
MYFKLAILMFCVTVNMQAQQYRDPAMKIDTIKSTTADGEYWQLKDVHGKLLEDGYVNHGALDGIWTSYHSTGFPASITNYKVGKKNGTQIRVGPDGFVEEMAAYQNDSLHGPYRTFFKGARIGKEMFYAHGIEDGLRRVFYFDAGIQEEAQIKMGKRDGKTTWYYKNGKVAVIYNYVNDLTEGISLAYYENGNLQTEGSFIHGNEDGLWKEYNENGKLKSEGNYTNGKKSGKWKMYIDEKNTKTENYD